MSNSISKLIDQWFSKKEPKQDHPIKEDNHTTFENDRGSLKYYFDLFHTCQIPDNKEIKDRVACSVHKLIEGKEKYQNVEKATGVPWYLIGAIHGKECSFNWNSGLLNGQPWHQVTTIVPKGKGPFKSWDEAAIFAMKHQEADKIKSWPVEIILQWAEKYNGLGYLKFHPDVKSPYIWASTNHYSKGKYVSDGKFDPNAISKSVGVAAILKELDRMNEIHLSFIFDDLS